MPEKWTGEIVAKLHIYRITQMELAEKAGYTPEYVSMVLNGAKTSSVVEHNLKGALDVLIKEKDQ